MTYTPPLNKENVIPLLTNVLPGILNDHPVMIAYLFGSVVEDLARSDSDVDIAIVVSPDEDLSAYESMELEFSIASNIEKKCGFNQVDVRSINHAPLTHQCSILTDGVLLYSKDEEFRVDYEVYIRSRYFDYQPVEEMMRKAFLQKLREIKTGYGESKEN